MYTTTVDWNWTAYVLLLFANILKYGGPFQIRQISQYIILLPGCCGNYYRRNRRGAVGSWRAGGETRHVRGDIARHK